MSAKGGGQASTMGDADDKLEPPKLARQEPLQVRAQGLCMLPALLCAPPKNLNSHMSVDGTSVAGKTDVDDGSGTGRRAKTCNYWINKLDCVQGMMYTLDKRDTTQAALAVSRERAKKWRL